MSSPVNAVKSERPSLNRAADELREIGLFSSNVSTRSGAGVAFSWGTGFVTSGIIVESIVPQKLQT
jgi:hypothetical protein